MIGLGSWYFNQPSPFWEIFEIGLLVITLSYSSCLLAAFEELTQPQPFDPSKLRSALCKQTIADAWWFLWPVKAEIWTSPYNRYSMVWKLWTHIAAVLPLAIGVLEPVQDLPIFSFSVKNISPKNKRGCQLEMGVFS